MQPADSYPVFLTEALKECRDFYCGYFDFEVVFEASWFVLLTSGGECHVSLAFMHPEHSSSLPTPARFTGDGAIFTVQVEDAGAEYEQVVGRGLQCDLTLRDEPWASAALASQTRAMSGWTLWSKFNLRAVGGTRI